MRVITHIHLFGLRQVSCFYDIFLCFAQIYKRICNVLAMKQSNTLKLNTVICSVKSKASKVQIG